MKLNASHKKALGIIVLLVFINLVATQFFKRVDFTSDGRYTLTESSLDLVKTIDKPVLIKVFLTGDLPSEFKRLQTEARYILEEFKAYNSNIKFEFVDPLEGDLDAMEVANQFYENGMSPESLNIRENGTLTERLIFPWAMAEYGGMQIPIQLLQKTLTQSNSEMIQRSVQNLEYAFIDGMTKLSRERTKKIAIIKGQGELADRYLADFLSTLKDYYLIAPFTLDSVNTSPQKTLDVLNTYDLIIDAKPTRAFTDEKNYLLDQYLMNGGKAIWLTEQVIAEKDSLYRASKKTVAFPRNLNLYSLFFRYGVRINPQLVNDLYSAPIVLASGSGNSTQLTRFPWFYDPLGNPADNHPITENLSPVKFEFANPIDTLESNLNKTILLESSNLSRVIGTPFEVTLDEITKEPDPRLYTTGHFPLAVLVEGEFNSAFKSKLKPFTLQSPKDKSPQTQQVFISDGDLIKNQLESGKPLELGFDRYTGLTYGNKTFLLNVVNYLLGDESLVKTRSKSIRLDEMNHEEIESTKLKWQLFNVIVPMLSIIAFGLVVVYWRKKKYKSY
ncbi:gliding motility ABC transporter-type substrate binding protein GldG [Psychroflexus torquis ATCC 700755]|uniref:Gliding motility ABC transporter-type substrate binding protein GldG n=1 Tax=Psychroflexus torquis (strain ATCC 700755 / CIP 106069 / ACAM 623) TaxID=313595 RepID=K4IAH5_PSYTT|nr:gliding motility-associated ABC transporter substrate-binding protein GldG [Psychroflexus torquis]AFU67429.1 gliding motility ABC transporter-type substrate binding protein GldG [Psychroflexus torquis ATCC 700755]